LCPGGTATFSVTATGQVPLTYQWKKNGVAIAGANSSTYSISSVASSDSGSYTVDVSGCNVVTSNPAGLTINGSPVITTQPASQTVCSGNNVTLTVATSGGLFTYQWRKNGVNIPGATSDSLSLSNIASSNAGSYDVIISGCSVNVTSAAATITVNPSTTITAQPSAQAVCAGSNVSFSVTASGSNLTYQWEKNGVNITGATSSTYTINSATSADSAMYQVTVTGSCGTVTSNAVPFVVNASTSISTAPVAQSVCNGAAAAFSVTATGSGSLTYQWRKAGVAIPGATASSLNFSSVAASDAANYDVIVTGNCGSDTSTAVSLTVNAGPAITTQPVSQLACAGGSATFTVTATGSNLTYQWRKAGVAITGATSSTLTINPVNATDTASYDVVVSGNCGGAVNSSTVTLSFKTATSITTQPVPQTVCALATTTMSVSAAGSGVLSYQWRKNGVNISGATTATYSIVNTAVTDSGHYDVVITGACGSVTSNSIVLTVNACTAVPNVNVDISSAVLMPSVAHNSTRLHLVAARAMKIDWVITDAKGNIVMKFTGTVNTGSNDIFIQLEKLAAGVYQITGNTSKGRLTTLRFIKQ
jgi:trimeric autotransporter adhesin